MHKLQSSRVCGVTQVVGEGGFIYCSVCICPIQPIQSLSKLLISEARNLARSHVLCFLREQINRGWVGGGTRLPPSSASSLCTPRLVGAVHCTGVPGDWGYSRDNLQVVCVEVVPVKRNIGKSRAEQSSVQCPLAASTLWSVLVTSAPLTSSSQHPSGKGVQASPQLFYPSISACPQLPGGRNDGAERAGTAGLVGHGANCSMDTKCAPTHLFRPSSIHSILF